MFCNNKNVQLFKRLNGMISRHATKSFSIKCSYQNIVHLPMTSGKEYYKSNFNFSTTTTGAVTNNEQVIEIDSPEKNEESKVMDGTEEQTPIPLPTIEGPLSKHEFQAETRKLLDIVTHSIYTDKEVFIRELISNASDALEKLRHLEASGETIIDPEIKNEISITTDEKKNTITIKDTGIGMTKEELIQNLGTIARSGSKSFIENLKTTSTNASTEIIGKFGVGFYASFMVADRVEVYSRSATKGNDSYVWKSDGLGAYDIAKVNDIPRGSQIVLYLKDSCKDFASSSRLSGIIKKYSNFVSSPILINKETVNTIQALWTVSDKKNIKEEEYNEFYKYISNAYDKPLFHFHFEADAPINLKTLFFIGSSHTEKLGFARLEPGVSLYSRKILIEKNCKDLLPDWLRFMRGIVDSEDLPLSLSREKMQDSRLLNRIRDIIVKKIIKFLDEKSRNDPKTYNKFITEYGSFIKEGICSDHQYKDLLAKLVRFDSSILKVNNNESDNSKNDDSIELTSFDEYVSRLPPDQNEIYYLCAPSRELAEQSPYYEAFRKNSKEVFFVYNTIDDFVMSAVNEFNGRKVVSIEKAKIENTDGSDQSIEKLTKEDAPLFTAWLKLELEKYVKDIKITNRLSDSPAIITEHESASVRKMMNIINQNTSSGFAQAKKHILEINPSHPIIVNLNKLREKEPLLAKKVAKQIHDNAALAAGLVEDGRIMIPRLTELLQDLITQSLDKHDNTK